MSEHEGCPVVSGPRVPLSRNACMPARAVRRSLLLPLPHEAPHVSSPSAASPRASRTRTMARPNRRPARPAVQVKGVKWTATVWVHTLPFRPEEWDPRRRTFNRGADEEDPGAQGGAGRRGLHRVPPASPRLQGSTRSVAQPRVPWTSERPRCPRRAVLGPSRRVPQVEGARRGEPPHTGPRPARHVALQHTVGLRCGPAWRRGLPLPDRGTSTPWSCRAAAQPCVEGLRPARQPC
jgi:hypothetical protein